MAGKRKATKAIKVTKADLSKSTTPIEIEVEDRPPPTDSELTSVRKHAAQQRMVMKDIEDLNAQLATKSEELRRLSEVDLPTAMLSCGLQSFVMQDGASVAIEVNTVASIPKDQLPGALKWLETNKHGSIIKRTVQLEFGKGEDKLAKKLLAFIKKNFRKQKLTDKRGVNHQTLGAFVREQLRQGATVPTDLLGVHTITRAVITTPAGGEASGSKGEPQL